MKIRLERDVLAEAVQWAARSLPTRPSVPILAGLLVRAENNQVVMSSFDYETSAQIAVKATVTDDGVALVEIRDREPFRKMVQKTFGQIPGAPALAAVDYKGAELWEMAGFAMAFVEDFGIVGQTDDVRRCVDASASESTLAETPGYQSASSEWLGGAVVATYSSAEHDADQLEASAKAQEELRKQIESGDGPGFDVEQMFAWQAVSTLTNPFGSTAVSYTHLTLPTNREV